ncbi:putative protoporphyrinogen oxidase [Phaeomoniella chlamydospora]|uniref:Protoporphyrinogen oxidase n=1 Tax=Phaeomoniella chlamydospora TaxID=158046 RepID=A0A0G2ET90_PHACM|nr:putative protoporphyrinogen oxidase [Phaeomoniella chlamydospora]
MALLTYMKISKLNLDDELVTISKNAPASLNRYIYYPDHLVRMPGPFPNTGLISNIVQNANILCEPAFDSFLSGVFRARAQRGAKVLDQSVGTFLSRLFNKSITDNLASAVIHGIYAGDLYNLSARSLFPVLWDIDGNDSFNRDLYRYGSGSRSYRPKPLVELLSFLWDRSSSFDQHIRGKVPKLDNTSVFTFKRGIQQLATALEDYLRAQSRVTLKLGTTVTKLAGSRSHLDKISVSTAPNTTSTEPSSTSVRAYDYVISTLSAPTMSRVLEFSHPSASKAFSAHDQAVNVMVVNLFYPQPDLLPVSGFGYLIPRSTPLGQNGECALGVIFGTDSSPGQDTAPGTKLTVMMGGHWWNGIPISDLPDPHEATKMARAILERHLNITAEPIIAEARLQTNAIPQYRVGHPFRLLQIERSLNSTTTMSPTAPPSGRLRLAGSWYSGVGVNDCITSARMAVEGIRQGHLDRAMDLYLHGTHPLSWILEERRGGESKFYERVPISST